MKSVEILRPYIRNGSFPIDSLSLFDSYADALEYAHNNPSAYPTQIIGVADKVSSQSEIYKLIYDPNKVYNYLLERIDIGNGANIFSFQGSVETFSKLPEAPLQGDMWFVEDENVFYIAFVSPKKEVQWRKLTIDIQVVTKAKDGLMSKDVYKTLFNETNSDAVYFSRKIDENPMTPENNSWLNVTSTTKEKNKAYSLPSIGTVKEIINGVLEQTAPHITVKSTIPTDHTFNTYISPILSIDFYQEFGGAPDGAKVYRYINGEDPELVWSGMPNFKKKNIANKEVLNWIYEEDEVITAQANSSIIYKVVVSYKEAEDGNLSAGFCEDYQKFNFYKVILYGHNLKQYNPLFCKNETIARLKYNPSDPEYGNEKINQIFINIPSGYYLESVEYTPQHDFYAKDLFTEIELPDGSKRYEYTLFGNMYFKNPGEFIFKVVLE